MSGIFLFFISVFCCEIPFGNGVQKLKYWERDPKFDARRTMPEMKQRNSNLTHLDKLKIQHKMEGANGTTKTDKATKPVLNNATQFFYNQSKQALRTRKAADSFAIPRAKKITKNYYKPAIRSTRMVPPKQKDGGTNKFTALTDDQNAELNLNVYNLKHQLEEIVSEYEGANVSVDVIGQTAEYIDIILLKATESKSGADKYFRADDSKYIDEVPEKKIIFIVHALSVKGFELLPCLYVLNEFKKLLSIYFEHLNQFDIFLIPLSNPDGAYSNKLLWNKNMSPQNDCPGVALDRNFDVAWNVNATVSSCSQQYPGPKPFSEPETRAIREVFHQYNHKIIGYFHVHADTYDFDTFKGDAVLYPKGYTDSQSDDDKYIDLRGEIDEAMKNASFQVISVTVDTLHNWYGKVSGTSVDYASTVYGIPYAMELVMQPYNDDSKSAKPEDSLSFHALNEIWQRTFDAILNNIYKSIKNNDE